MWRALAVGMAIALGCSVSAHARQNEADALEQSQGAIGDVVPDLKFKSADGTQITLAELRGKPLLINLIYTGCADVCPATIERLAPAIDAANEALGSGSYDVLTIGFDTRNDTPERMQSYARSHGAGGSNWHFVATDQGTMERLTRAVGYSLFPSAGGFDHMAQITMIDKTGKIYRQIYGSDFEPPAIVEPLKELVYGREQSFFSVAGLVDRVKLFCTVYNPNTGRYYFNYSLFASIVIGAGCLLAVLAFLIREMRKHSLSGGA